MLRLTSKTCTKFSVIFLACSIFSVLLLMISRLDFFHRFALLSDFQERSDIFFYYLCCFFSGISLIFSTGARSKVLKWLIRIGHFSCIYVIGLFWICLMIVQNFPFLIVISIFLLLPICLLKTNDQKWVAIVCLGLPMFVSIILFIKLNYELITSGDYWSTLGLMIFLSISGLVGLILTTNLHNKNRKVKWLLLGINYLFATYFHVAILLFGF